MEKILLYYRFMPVADPEAVRLWQRTLCEKLGLKGRILISQHGINGTVGGELAALKSVFGEGGPAISSTKYATGHLLGAAGGLEAIITVQALREGILPPTLNLTDPDAAAAGLDLIGPSARRASVDYALSNGFGFGGVNASIVLRRMPIGREVSAPES